MLGGIGAFGTSGVLLGPLLVRLSVEGLAIAREQGLFREQSS
jgi:predicted PurR-regulated permease PerM